MSRFQQDAVAAHLIAGIGLQVRLRWCEGFVQAIVSRAFAAEAAQRACDSAGIPGQSAAGGC